MLVRTIGGHLGTPDTLALMAPNAAEVDRSGSEALFMTEAEWLSCTDPDVMLRHLGPAAGERKRYLFACACCRRTWHLLNDPRSRRAVEVAELYADDQIGEEELRDAAFDAEDAEHPDNPGWAGAYYVACQTFDAETAAYYARVGLSPAARESGINAARPDEPELVREAQAQSDLLRDIFGNPYRPAVVVPAVLGWNDGTVPKMAQGIYDERAFERMPILADALQEAGCSTDAILEHCRTSCNHVRGCWLIDLLIGKR
jgi:hypothetical protein